MEQSGQSGEGDFLSLNFELNSVVYATFNYVNVTTPTHTPFKLTIKLMRKKKEKKRAQA